MSAPPVHVVDIGDAPVARDGAEAPAPGAARREPGALARAVAALWRAARRVSAPAA